MATTNTDTNTALDQLAAITPGCKIGHPDELAGITRTEDPCTNPADFYVDYHCCCPGKPSWGHGQITVCADHLATWTTGIQQRLKSAGRPGCVECRMPINEISDLIWNVTPLHA